MGFYQIKQVILMRRDLNMTRGKEIAQGAHASMKATLENMNNPLVKEWLAGSFAKIALSVDSMDELHDICLKARLRDLIVAEIIDSGKTMFDNVPTLTCAAIGPAKSEDFIGLTDHLKLR